MSMYTFIYFDEEKKKCKLKSYKYFNKTEIIYCILCYIENFLNQISKKKTWGKFMFLYDIGLLHTFSIIIKFNAYEEGCIYVFKDCSRLLLCNIYNCF